MTTIFDDSAIKLGAVKILAYSPRKGEVFCYHYFNKDNLEIAYYIVDMGKLTVLENPREWDKEFLLHADYKKLDL